MELLDWAVCVLPPIVGAVLTAYVLELAERLFYR